MYNTNDTNNVGTQNFVHDDGKHMLPPFPQTPVLAHVAREWIEKVKPKLAGAGLLAVAEGKNPAACDKIINFDLEKLPELPPDHRLYEQALKHA